MTPQQMEKHYSEWCCKQTHLIDGLALFLSGPMVFAQMMRASGDAYFFVMFLIICTLLVTTKLWLLDPAKYRKWRLPLRSGMWYLSGICSVLLFTRLETALRSGQPNALRTAVLMSKWPDLGLLMIMLPLGNRYLVKTGLPVLLLFHFAALMAAILSGDGVDASPLFSGAVNKANATLDVVLRIFSAVYGFTPLRSEAIMGLPGRFWVLAYWLLAQSVVFWSVWLGSVVWEAKAMATFLRTCGESPGARGDLLRTFKLCMFLQVSVAGLALGCIVHKPSVASLSSILFNIILLRS